jgi:O-antigen ligase
LNTFVASTTSAFLFLAAFTGSAGLRSTALILAAFGLAAAWRASVAPHVRRLPRGFCLAYVAWALLAVASLAWSVDARYTLQELRGEVFYGTLVLSVFLLAALGDGARWRTWCYAMLLGTLAVFLAHLVQAAFGLSFTRHTVFEQRGPWSTHLVLVAPLVLALAWRAPWGAHRGVAFAVGAMALLLYAAWETDNRIVWVALAAQFLIVASLRPPDANGGTRAMRWVAVAAAGVATVALAASIADRSSLRAADGLERDLRPRIWGVAWDKFKQAPVLGHGFGREILAADFAPHTPKALDHPQIRHGHNVFVDIALQMGLVGLAVFVTLLLILAREYRGYLRRAELAPLGVIGFMVLAGFLAKSMTDDFLHRHNGLVFWALNAMLLGLGRAAPPQSAPATTPPAEAAGPR